MVVKDCHEIIPGSKVGLSLIHICGVEAPYEGEDRCVIPSPKVATYDLKPEMSAPERCV